MSSSQKRSPKILIPTHVYGTNWVSIDQYLELLDLVHIIAERLDKIEEALIDNIPSMQNILGEDCESSTSEESMEDSSLVDLTVFELDEYDPKKYYV